MSNPAIFVLFSDLSGTGNIKYIQIEDNLGEAIHIHLNDFRLDITINEFEELAFLFEEALSSLDGNTERLVKAPQFLAETYKYFNFEKINYELNKVVLKDLKFIVRKSYLKYFFAVQLKNIKKTPQYKKLEGKNIKLSKQFQYSSLQQNDTKRMESALKHVTNHNRNLSNYNIITYGKNCIVRDGLHTAAILAHKYSINMEVEVINIKNHKVFYDFNWTFFWSVKIVINISLIIAKRILISFFSKIRSN